MFFNTANKKKPGLNIVYQLCRTVKHFIDRFDFERELTCKQTSYTITIFFEPSQII